MAFLHPFSFYLQEKKMDANSPTTAAAAAAAAADVDESLEILEAIQKHYDNNETPSANGTTTATTATTTTTATPPETEEEVVSTKRVPGSEGRDKLLEFVPTEEELEQYKEDMAELMEKPDTGGATYNNNNNNTTVVVVGDGAGTQYDGRPGTTITSNTAGLAMGIPSSSSGANAITPGGAGTAVSMPGAYALGGPGAEGTVAHHQAPAVNTNTNTNANTNATDVEAPNQVVQDNTGLAVATEVSESNDNRAQELPRATSFDAEDVGNETQQREAIDRKAKKRSANLVIGGIVLLIVIVAPLATFLSKDSDKPNTNLPASTLAPTSQMDRMEATLQLMLPDYTLQEVDQPGSSQSLAYQWILQDPYLYKYVDTEWRVLQRFALATFFYATGGEGWMHNDIWLSYEHNECEWYANEAFAPPPEITGGITGILPEFPNACELPANSNRSSDYGHPYKHIWLMGNGLAGTLPLELYLLTSLRSMSLLLNDLQGTLSTHIGQLSRLEAFTFSRNSVITGSLPTELGAIPNLNFLDGTANALTGKVPSELGRAPLEYLMMDENFITGTIPSELFNIPARYRLLLLDRNQMTGTLPSEIGNVKNCQQLLLSTNSFNGTVRRYRERVSLMKLQHDTSTTHLLHYPSQIPSEIGNMELGGHVTLSNNSFSGTIPTELGQIGRPPWATYLSIEIAFNSLTGTVPSEVGLLSHIDYFIASYNKLSGTIPEELEVLFTTTNGNLKTFDVSFNDGMDGSDMNQLCFVNETFFENGCRESSPFETSFYCQCKCECAAHNFTNVTELPP